MSARFRIALVAVGLASGPCALTAQAPSLWVRGASGETRRIEVNDDRGYGVVDAEIFRSFGWSVSIDGDTLSLVTDTGARVELVAEDPFFRWERDLVQLADEPYRRGDRMLVPVQLLVDFVPRRLDDFTFDPVARVLSEKQGDVAGADVSAAPRTRTPRPRVVVIDAGHGGADQGAVGRSGVREKDVALSVARALARELEADSSIRVYLTRDRDVLIPIWRRGEQATRWRGPSPGVFLSLHANALPPSKATRGYETYFLSEARTEHERRVAAIENASTSESGDVGGDLPDPELDLILNELRTLDHQHWSALLAELVQEELRTAHDGPDRGVKQAPFAVITNALMPAVLVELGFLTNAADERLLGNPEFHVDAASALARAVQRFLDRYDPDPELVRDSQW